MGNAVSLGSAPSSAVAPQSKATEPFRDYQPQSASAEQRPPEPSWESSLSDPIVFATLWLAVATTALGVFTYRLWRATIRLATDAKASGDAHAAKMERSIGEAAKAAQAMEKMANAAYAQAGITEQSLIEARRSADAVAAQVKVAQDTARRQLRAYVIPAVFRVKNVCVGGIPEFSLVLRNAGQTPAYEVRGLVTTFYARDVSADNKKVYTARDTGSQGSKGVIGSGGLLRFRTSRRTALTANEIDEIKNGKLEIGVFGLVSYRDTFGRRRLATFKRFLLPKNLRKDGKARLAICSKGNSAN